MKENNLVNRKSLATSNKSSSGQISRNKQKKIYNVKTKDKKIIDFVRIAFHIPEYKNAIDIGKIIKSYNYLVGLNLMQISRCNITYLNKITKKIRLNINNKYNYIDTLIFFCS